MSEASDGAATAALAGRSLVVAIRSSEADQFSVTRLYSMLLVHGFRAKGIDVRSIEIADAGSAHALLDAVFDARVAAIYFTAPIAAIEAMALRPPTAQPLASALRSKRFVIQIGNPAFYPNSIRVAGATLANARYVHIDSDSLAYAAEADGSAGRLVFHHLPVAIPATTPAPLRSRRADLLFAASLSDPDTLRASWIDAHPSQASVLEALVEAIRPFDVSAWKTAKRLLAENGMPQNVHGRSGAEILTAANRIAYMEGKRDLMRRLSRFPITYVVSGALPRIPISARSRQLPPMPAERLYALTAETRGSIWYPPNRMIGAVASRLPNTLSVGAIPVLGVTPGVESIPECREAVIGYDWTFAGLEDGIERLLTRPQDFEEIAARGPMLAARHFSPQRFLDAMLALAT